MNLMDALKSVRLSKKQEALMPLSTRWGKALDPDHVLEEYPRPQMRRESYLNLNGYWQYAITRSKELPAEYDGRILVPFSPEASLSGVQCQLQPDEFLWYAKTIQVQQQKGRCLLHFGAVDQTAIVYINDKEVAHHTGGYLPFTIDISEALQEFITIIVCVQDASDTSYLSKGKQRLARGGMYYTAQSGIWQSVWIEWVSEVYIQEVVITPVFDQDMVHVAITLSQPCSLPIIAQVLSNQQVIAEKHSDSLGFDMKLPVKQAWTPDTPYLYDIRIQAGEDEVLCYFAMRCFTVEPDADGIPRICLNHQPLFMDGVLDQGYWPDGLYTAPSDEAMIYDISMMKQLGFQMLRKHIKIEPSRWYYHCDRLGMIVWQDMVNGGMPYHTWFITWMPSMISWTKKHIKDTHYRLLARKGKQQQEAWIAECKETIRHLRSFPCISTWVIFNEGWGQFDTLRVSELLRKEDPERLFDAASGWFDQQCGDFRSEHHYFDKPQMMPDDRAFVLSEYGGYACQIKEHSSVSKIYGYHTYASCEEFSAAYQNLKSEIIAPLIQKGLCAAVYTQLSDIEEEVNGILTYDRELCKLMLPERMGHE